jgi:hypothetical protein
LLEKMSGEMLGVIAKLEGGRCLPMVGAQHGSEIEQVIA